MKPLFCALALCTTLAPALSQEAATPPVATNFMPLEPQLIIATQTNDGLTITPVELPVDHVGTMLGIKMWQFKIEPPRDATPATRLRYRLELQRPGQKPIEMDSGRLDFSVNEVPRTLEFTFGLMPEGKETIDNAETLKVYAATHIWESKSSIGNQAIIGHFNNPLAKLNVLAPILGGALSAEVYANGTAQLIQLAVEGDDREDGDSEVVLVLTAETPQPKK